MANFLIPLESEDPSFKIKTILQDIELVLRFDWNTRQEKWHISFYNSEESPLILGIPLNIDSEIIGRFKIDGMPKGKMILFDTSLKNIECGRSDLGDRCKLIYVESE